MAEKETAKRMKISDIFPEEAIKHAKAAREEMWKSVELLFPPEFIEHRRKARKEMLLAFREVIEHAIERIEAKE